MPNGIYARGARNSLDELSQSTWVEIAQFKTRQEAEQNALVLVAAGFSSQIIAVEAEFALLVADTEAIEARRELASYAEEDRPSAGPALPSIPLRESVTGVMAYWCVLLFLNSASTRHALDIDWFSIGEGSAGRIVAGEWWRAFTALGLHVDLGHLLSNLAAGTLFGFFLSEFLGSGLAWLLILLAGGGGNALNAFIHSPSHTSVGASTAIFGAIGLLAVLAIRYRRSQWKTGLRQWAPLSAGVMLLAFLGIEGERIDIGAHLAGFFIGCVVGGLLLTEPPRAASRGTTIACGSAALGLFAGAWILAMTSNGS